MTGGPVRIVGPNGDIQEVPQSRTTMGKSIVAAALAGLMTPSHYRETPYGPVRDYSADMAGAAQAGQNAYAKPQQRAQAQSNLQQTRKLFTLQNNVKLVQQAAAMAHQQHAVLDDVVKTNTEKFANPLAEWDTDITQRGKLIESINDSEDRIAAAEQKMKDAGVDPALADSLHKQRMAGRDFRKSLIKNTNPDGSVNIKGLWNDAKALRTSKFGDRLEQFFGSKEAADEYQAKLVAMDKLGAHAIRAQKIAKMIGWGLAIPAGLKTAGAIAHTAMVP
jgi:hypothetical protein